MLRWEPPVRMDTIVRGRGAGRLAQCSSSNPDGAASAACAHCPQTGLAPGSLVLHDITEPLFGEETLGSTCVEPHAPSGIGAIGDGCADDYCACQSASHKPVAKGRPGGLPPQPDHDLMVELGDEAE